MTQLDITYNGLVNGALYALFLVGILIVYRAGKIVNFAYGQYGMFGAFFCWYLYATLGLADWLAIIVGLVVAAGLSVLTRIVFFERQFRIAAGYDLIVTLGAFLAIAALAQLCFGVTSQSFLTLGALTLHGHGAFVANDNDFLVLGFAALTIGVVGLLYSRTRIGMWLRAVGLNPMVAESSGIDIQTLNRGVWVVSGLISGVTAMLVASRLAVDAYYMTSFLIKAFVAGMIGGLDRFWTPLAAAVALGVYEAWAVFFFGGQAEIPADFVAIMVLLTVLPRSFVSEDTEVRA